MVKGNNFLFVLQSITASVLALYCMCAAAGATSTPAPESCEKAARSDATLDDRMTFDDLVRLSLRLKAMPTSGDKLALHDEFKRKFISLSEAMGPGFLDLFKRRENELRGQVQGEKQVESQARERQNKIFKWSELQEHPFKFSPNNAIFLDENTLLIAGEHGLHTYDLTTGSIVHTKPVTNIFPASPMILSADHSKLYVFSSTYDSLIIIDLKDLTRKAEYVSTPGISRVEGLSLSPDGQHLIAGSNDGAVMLVGLSDPRNQQVIDKKTEVNRPRKTVRFSSDGRYAIGVGYQRVPSIIDVAKHVPVKIGWNQGTPQAIQFTPIFWTDADFIPGTHQIILIEKTDSRIYIFDLDTEKVTMTDIQFPDARKIRMSKDGQTAILSRRLGSTAPDQIAAFDVKTGRNLNLAFPQDQISLTLIGESADQLVYMDTTGKKNMYFVDRETLKITPALLPHETDAGENTAVLSPSGEALIFQPVLGKSLWHLK